MALVGKLLMIQPAFSLSALNAGKPSASCCLIWIFFSLAAFCTAPSAFPDNIAGWYAVAGSIAFYRFQPATGLTIR